MPLKRAYSQPIDDVSFFPFGEHFLTFGATFFTWCDFFLWSDFFSLARLFFLWRDFFSLARLFFFGVTFFFSGATFFYLARLFFFGTTFFLWHDFFLSCATFFSGGHLYTATRFVAGSKFEHVWLSKDGRLG